MSMAPSPLYSIYVWFYFRSFIYTHGRLHRPLRGAKGSGSQGGQQTASDYDKRGQSISDTSTQRWGKKANIIVGAVHLKESSRTEGRRGQRRVLLPGPAWAFRTCRQRQSRTRSPATPLTPKPRRFERVGKLMVSVFNDPEEWTCSYTTRPPTTRLVGAVEPPTGQSRMGASRRPPGAHAATWAVPGSAW